MQVIFPWICGWLADKFPTTYSRHNPLFDVEDDISLFAANYFVSMEGYLNCFDPADV